MPSLLLSCIPIFSYDRIPILVNTLLFEISLLSIIFHGQYLMATLSPHMCVTLPQWVKRRTVAKRQLWNDKGLVSFNDIILCTVVSMLLYILHLSISVPADKIRGSLHVNVLISSRWSSIMLCWFNCISNAVVCSLCWAIDLITWFGVWPFSK